MKIKFPKIKINPTDVEERRLGARIGLETLVVLAENNGC